MKLKLDQNLPARLAQMLVSLGYDVHTVSDENLSGHPVADTWQAACREVLLSSRKTRLG